MCEEVNETDRRRSTRRRRRGFGTLGRKRAADSKNPRRGGEGVGYGGQYSNGDTGGFSDQFWEDQRPPHWG